MGVTQSLQRIQTFYNYHKLIQNNQSVQKQQYQLYFGSQFQLYASKFNHKQIFTKHTIRFNQVKQMQNFIDEWKLMRESKGNMLPFNILYPINVFVKEGAGSLMEKLPANCGGTEGHLVVVHKWLARSLCDYVKEGQSPLNEQSVWFIVNQLSKSLEILEENNHASYHIMPENIWHNANHNWFLYDGRFIIGTQSIQQFYQQKLKNQHFMSEDMKKKIQSNALITNNDSLQQDVYCLGYCMIFMITGIHPKEMPKNSHERDIFVYQLLDSLVQKSLHSTSSKGQQNQQNSDKDEIMKYSNQLISFIKNLIKSDPKRRFTIRHIRSYLKSKQQQIFMKQVQQWSRHQLEKSQSRHRINKKEENLFQSWNIKKFQRAKSPPRQLYKRIATQNSQGESNFTSMRTLKKQPIPQKMVMINSRQLKKPAFNLIENDSKNNKLQRSGQFTPIRKIEQTTTNRFNFQSIERKTKTQPININNNICNRISTQIRQLNSPQRCRNQPPFMSPNKQSNSSINTRAYVDPNSHQQNYPNLRFSSKPHLVMHSPSSHQQNIVVLSPNKVKVVYQSPRKTYM